MKTDDELQVPVDAPHETGADYVMPSAPRAPGELLVSSEDERASDVPPGRGPASGAVARAFGARFGLHADTLGLLLVEVRSRIEHLDLAVEEDSRAQLKGAVRNLGEVLGWCEALRDDLADESRYAHAGCEPTELADLCREAVVGLSLDDATTDSVVAVRGDEEVVAWGRRGDCLDLVRSALHVVWQRLGGRGVMALAVGWRDGAPCISVQGRGVAQTDRLDEDRLAALQAARKRCGVGRAG